MRIATFNVENLGPCYAEKQITEGMTRHQYLTLDIEVAIVERLRGLRRNGDGPAGEVSRSAGLV